MLPQYSIIHHQQLTSPYPSDLNPPTLNLKSPRTIPKTSPMDKVFLKLNFCRTLGNCVIAVKILHCAWVVFYKFKIRQRKYSMSYELAINPSPTIIDSLFEASLISTSWRNRDNAKIYSRLPLHAFLTFAKASGVDNNTDIVLLKEYIASAKNIMELGAGYGRVLQYLIQHSSAHISGIERDRKLCKHLINNFEDNVEVIQADLKKHEFTREKYDLMLWLWAGFCEFSESEQLDALAQVTLGLSPGGRIVIDTLDYATMPIKATHKDGGYVEADTPYGVERLFVPNTVHFYRYANQLGLIIEKELYYEPLKGKLRTLYVFKKPFKLH